MNIYRGDPRSFAFDPIAPCVAHVAVRIGAHRPLRKEQRVFLYVPFMHCELAVIHEWAVKLFTELGIKPDLEYESRNKGIIDRFGIHPDRTRILGRASTLEELAFVAQESPSFLTAIGAHGIRVPLPRPTHGTSCRTVHQEFSYSNALSAATP